LGANFGPSNAGTIEARAIKRPILASCLPQCRLLIQRNDWQEDSTCNGIMRMYTIDSIAIQSDDDDDDDTEPKEVGDAIPNSVRQT
jgi:hypothetical protein